MTQEQATELVQAEKGMTFEKYEREEVEIKIPDDYMDIIKSTMDGYKKWLKENGSLQEKANQAETDEEREESLAECTQHFKTRYGGVVAKDTGERLSVSQITRTWERFMRKEYRGFMNAHVNMTIEQILRIGVDKFVYVMGWKKPSDVHTWRNNKLRVGACCHCQDQFIPMIIQQNHGLCGNCRPEYSSKAIRKFIIRQANVSERYEGAHHDLLMDFFIMFYHDAQFRKLFRAESESAKEMEAMTDEVPEWVHKGRKEVNEDA